MGRPLFFRLLLTSLFLVPPSHAAEQSLAEAARKEAERRKALEQQGIEGRVISMDAARATAGSERSGAVLLPDRPSESGTERLRKSQPSLRILRSNLRKLDLEIQHGVERLALLRARMESERWQLPRVGRNSRASGSNSARERLGFQIKELETKLNHLRRERFQTYDSGRKAGFLPGELDGKGVVP